MGFLVGLTTLAAAIAAWRMRAPRRLFLLALSLPLLVLAQGVLGGITVLVELNPVIVMSHFLLSLVGVALAVVLVLEIGAVDPPGEPAVSPELGLARARARSAGARARRLRDVRDRGGAALRRGGHRAPGDAGGSVYIHVRVTAVFGLAYLAFVAALLRGRS